MNVTSELTRTILARTGGDCHICHDGVGPRSYGRTDSPLGWEIDHSVPRAKGGIDRRNNLYAAHIRCNRSKGVKSSRSARGQHGYTSAPLSMRRRKELHMQHQLIAGAVGELAGYLIAEHLNVATETKWLLIVGCGLAGIVLVHTFQSN